MTIMPKLKRPSANETFAGLETALKWLERQPKCDLMQRHTVNGICELATRKQVSLFSLAFRMGTCQNPDDSISFRN